MGVKNSERIALFLLVGCLVVTTASASEYAFIDADPHVLSAEPNYLRDVCSIPNDALFSQQWALLNNGQNGGVEGSDIDAVEAWNLTTGSEEVIIAVIDSGVDYTHPDLRDNIWRNTDEIPENGKDDDNNGYVDDVIGWDFCSGKNDPMDAFGHGTHVAGILGAAGNNEIGTAGVNWHVRIMPLKVYGPNTSTADSASIAEAIRYASANGAAIITCSIGGSSYSRVEFDAIEASNSLIVCAAGNDGVNTDVVARYPACYPCDNIISVAASDGSDLLASEPRWRSNYGNTSVDVAAPGVEIVSSCIGEEWCFEDNVTSLSNWIAEHPWEMRNVLINGSDGRQEVVRCAGIDIDRNDTGTINSTLTLRDPVDLSEVRFAGLYVRTPFDTVPDNDGLLVEASNSSGEWKTLEYSRGLAEKSIAGDFLDLAPFEGDSGVKVRLRFVSGENGTATGVCIGYVAIIARTNGEPAYVSMNGTSMAASYVSGLAGLVKSMDLNLTPVEIRQYILDNVDPIDSLDGKVATGGRINASKTLQAVGGACASHHLTDDFTAPATTGEAPRSVQCTGMSAGNITGW